MNGTSDSELHLLLRSRSEAKHRNIQKTTDHCNRKNTWQPLGLKKHYNKVNDYHAEPRAAILGRLFWRQHARRRNCDTESARPASSDKHGKQFRHTQHPHHVSPTVHVAISTSSSIRLCSCCERIGSFTSDNPVPDFRRHQSKKMQHFRYLIHYFFCFPTVCVRKSISTCIALANSCPAARQTNSDRVTKMLSLH